MVKNENFYKYLLFDSMCESETSICTVWLQWFRSIPTDILQKIGFIRFFSVSKFLSTLDVEILPCLRKPFGKDYSLDDILADPENAIERCFSAENKRACVQAVLNPYSWAQPWTDRHDYQIIKKE